MEFSDPSYDRLETDRSFTHDFPAPVVSSYRMCLQLLRAATDEADLASMRMLDLRPLGNPSALHSIRLTDAYVLMLELKACSRGCVLWIVGVQPSSTVP